MSSKPFLILRFPPLIDCILFCSTVAPTDATFTACLNRFWISNVPRKHSLTPSKLNELSFFFNYGSPLNCFLFCLLSKTS